MEMENLIFGLPASRSSSSSTVRMNEGERGGRSLKNGHGQSTENCGLHACRATLLFDNYCLACFVAPERSRCVSALGQVRNCFSEALESNKIKQ